MDINFREATDQDHEAIKELSIGIYEKTDTLVHSFIDWLKSDEWFLFVGEMNQRKVIAFIAIHVPDSFKSMTIRRARVDKEYRGLGVYKALLNYTVRYVRKKVRDVKFLYRLQAIDVRVPGGYEIVKQTGLMIIFVSGNATLSSAMNQFVHSKLQFMTWPELKMLYDSNDAVKDLFINSVLDIGGDIFNLNFIANWKLLAERYDTRIMITKHKGIDGKIEIMVSFLRLGKFLTTNEGIPMAAMNVYGLNKSGVMRHIVKGILEASKHVKGERFAMEFFLAKDIFKECVNFLKEVSGWDICYHLEMNLLFGDLSGNLEDIWSN